MTRRRAALGLTCLALIGLAASATIASADTTAADKPAREKIKVGSIGPEWKKLKDLDDKPHSLKDIAKAKAVVVVFTCDHCPVAKAYEDRFNQFAKDYKEKGVEFVAINVSKGEADDPEKMKKLAGENGLEFTYLMDPSQDIGRAYGATVTPHAFVLDGKRRVAYMGAFDDSMNPKEVKQHLVRDAVDALLAGSKPKVAEFKQFGCGISYE